MSTLYSASICVSDIPKEKVVKSEKNGKSYLNIDVWINDEKDQYGNEGSINIRQSKEEREAKEKRTYIGNLKRVEAIKPQAATVQEESTDLPF